MRNSISIFVALLAASTVVGCSSRRCRHHHHDGQVVAESPGVYQISQPEDAPAAPFYREPVTETPVAPEPEQEPVIAETVDSNYGHSADYKRLVGRIQRVHVPGGEWKLRYAPLDQRDEWGGSMVLAPDVRLENFADDTVVYVEGEIIVKRPSLYLTGPLFRIRDIRIATQRDRISLNYDR